MMRMTTTKKMVEKIILMLMVMIWSYESLQSQYGNMCLALFESLSVINALNHLVNNVLSRCTCLLTLLKSHMDVNNAIKHLVRQVLWSITSYTLILGRGGIREAAKKKNFFLGNLSQMWVGGVAVSQTRSKPLKTPPNHPENRPFWPEFHLSFSQISQKPWGEWVGKQIWERSPKKNVCFFWQLS